MYLSQDAWVFLGFYHPQAVEQSSAFDPSILCNPYVNGSVLCVYQWGNLLYYKYSVLGHISSKCNINVSLTRAEFMHLRNFYQDPRLNCEFNFIILSQAYNNQEPIRDQQRLNNNCLITHLNSVIVKVMRPNPKQSTQVINNNGNSNSNSDNNVEFVNVDLPCNKLNI